MAFLLDLSRSVNNPHWIFDNKVVLLGVSKRRADKAEEFMYSLRTSSLLQYMLAEYLYIMSFDLFQRLSVLEVWGDMLIKDTDKES